MYPSVVRGLLALLFLLSACTPAPAAVRHEVILDVTNNRDDPVIIRVVPRILEQRGVPGRVDTGDGDGSEVAPGERRTLRLTMTSGEWTISVNGDPIISSSDHEFIEGGWTAGRLVVDPEEAFLELDRSEALPSN